MSERILVAVERQQKVLDELVAQRTDRGPTPFITEARDLDSSLDDVDLEIISRNDTPKTPITGSDMILSWPIFPRNKPVHTFPAYAYAEKEKNIDPHCQQTMLRSMIGYDGSQRPSQLRFGRQPRHACRLSCIGGHKARSVPTG